MVRLVLISLSCFAFVALSAFASAQTVGGSGSSTNGESQAEHSRCSVSEFVSSSRFPLVVELGRSRLLRFPNGVHRTALSNTDSSSVVQISLQEVLVLGIKEGAADLTVWPSEGETGPTVILVRVQRRVP